MADATTQTSLQALQAQMIKSNLRTFLAAGHVVGGEHLSGESKTGNKYSFYNIQMKTSSPKITEFSCATQKNDRLQAAIDNEEYIFISIKGARASGYTVSYNVDEITFADGSTIKAE
ncbi:MAG: hypothetical protein OWR52_12565 [Acidibacillus sp.]|nr:hypothetical protein [Acidibacillus sp.]